MADTDIDEEWTDIFKTHGGEFSPSDWDEWVDDGLADVIR